MESNKQSISQDREFKENIIPFIHRKSLLLSISFRSLSLEMSEFKMKVESIFPDELKEPLITGLCETTIVILKKYNIIFKKNYRSQNSK